VLSRASRFAMRAAALLSDPVGQIQVSFTGVKNWCATPSHYWTVSSFCFRRDPYVRFPGVFSSSNGTATIPQGVNETNLLYACYNVLFCITFAIFVAG
jgi:hypothetical protein